MRTEATEAEKRWWRQFRRCINRMPPTMEVLVGAYGQISAAERGATKYAFESYGTLDNTVALVDLPSAYPQGVVNHDGAQ